MRPFISLVLAGLLALPSAAQARQTAQQDPSIVLVPGTVPVDEPSQQAVASALNRAAGLFPEIRYFAITDVRRQEAWALVSVIGLAKVHADLTWGIDDGAWFGLVLVRHQGSNIPVGAVQGTLEFSELMRQVPDEFVSGAARRALDPLRAGPVQDAGGYIFPWQPGTSMYYGDLGVHTNGYASVVNGWQAVDMFSDGDTDAGHAPNLLLAAAAGTVEYKCTDANNAAIKVGDFFYTHLQVSGSPEEGTSFSQGDALGQLQTGTFGEEHQWCGWATQPDDWFHVHWGFRDADLRVEDWSLSMSTQNWTGGCKTVTPGGGWILADGDQDLHISGTARVPYAKLTCDGGQTQTVTADASGNYSIGVPPGWSGTVMPSLTGCTFDPPATAYNNVTTDIGDQNYAADCSVTFRSIGTQDGWILESGETSGKGGTLDAASSLFNLGDDAGNKQYRAILSFNTGSLPDSAVIQGATLKIRRTELVGASPFGSLGNIIVDVRKGGFSGAAALQASDFSAAGTKNYIAQIPGNPVDGWYIKALGANTFGYINLTGGTQFRLRFATDDNNNLAADYLRFASGSAAVTSRPALILTYHAPAP